MLSGIAIKQMAIGSFKNFVITGKANKKRLDEIEGFIKEVECNWRSDLPRVLDYEKLFMKNMLSFCVYEINARGEIRLSRDPEKAMRNMLPSAFNEIPPAGYFKRKLTKAWSIVNGFFVPANPQKLSKTVDTAFQRNYEMAEPDFDWNKSPKKFSLFSFKLNYKYLIEKLILIGGPSYHSVHDIYLREDSMKNGALLLIALRRYKDENGSWPENLDEIKGLTKEENFIDPTNGQSFVYKLADNGFVLYSKGENGIDNGGQQFSYHKDKENDDINIWPLKQCQKELPKKTSGEPNDTQRD